MHRSMLNWLRCFLPLFYVLTSYTYANVQEKHFDAKVIGIKDGDTIEVLHKGQSEVVRLSGIDCPERKQPFGSAAKKFTSILCFGKTVEVRGSKKDRYGRLIAEVFVDGLSVNRILLSSGYAWHFKKYSNRSDYTALENEARKAKKGLWADANPVPPWEWRKGNR